MYLISVGEGRGGTTIRHSRVEVAIDNLLAFETHIKILCSKASQELYVFSSIVIYEL